MIEPAPSARAQRVALNALSGIGARVATMVVGFMLTPLIVHAIGLTVFGLWSVLAAVVGYIGLLDFGLGGAFVKFISGYVESGKFDAARDVVSFGMSFYAVFGAILGFPFFAFTPALVHLFKMPAAETAEAIWLFRALFVVVIAWLIVGLLSTMVIALHRMDLANRNNVVAYLVYAIAAAVLLRLHLSVAALVAASFIQLVVTAVLQYLTAHSLFGEQIWSLPTTWNRTVIRELFQFGGWTQLTSLFSILSLDVGRFVTASVVGVTHVAYYELGGKLSYISLSLPGNFLNALIPAAAAADARGDEDLLARMYRSGTAYIVFGTLLIAGFIAGAAGPIVRVWMGEPLPYVSTIVTLLAGGYAIGSLSEIGRALVRAIGLPQYETTFAVIAGMVSLVGTLVLGRCYGVVGVAAGSTLGWVSGSVAFLLIFHRLRRVSFWSTVGAPASRLFAAAFVSAWSLRVVLAAPAIAPLFANRVTGALALSVGGCGYVVAFGLLVWLLRVEHFDEGRFLSRLLTALSARLIGWVPESR